MSVFLAVCAISFSSKIVIPADLEKIYRTTFNCPAEVYKIPKMAQAPIFKINNYFPATPAYWPVLLASNQKLDKQARSWSKYGIHPALILPSDPMKAMNDSKQINRLLAAQLVGAIPIAPLSRTTSNELYAARYMWCMMGLCPAAWYLKKGLNTDISLMPKGLYIVAPHWSGSSRLPLPNREINYLGRIILPLHDSIPKPGGTVAVENMSAYAHAFTPSIKTCWRWIGISFCRDKEKLHTTFLGRSLLVVGGISVAFWHLISELHGNLILIASTGLGWLAFWIAIINLIIIVALLFQRRSFRR